MAKLVILMITAFIDMVGMLMVLPILPFYAKSFGGGGLVVGLLISSFAIAQLLTAPLWGRFSDRYGRRPALLVGLAASGIAFVIFAYADALWLLFLSRLVQGAGGGTVGVIQAYVADAVEPEQRARALGWLSAATNAGVAIGPALGSLSSSLGREAPGLFAAGLCVLNVFFASRYLSESRDMSDAGQHAPKRGRSLQAVTRVLTHSGEPAARLIWIYAIAMGAFNGVNAVLALFLAARYGVTEKTIGFFFVYIGTLSVVTRALVLGWAVDRFGEARLSRVGSTLLAMGIFAMPFVPRLDNWSLLPLAIAVALIPLGTAFTFPCVTAMLSRVIPSHERGLYMGVQQTFGGVARVVFPIIAGWAFDRVLALPFVLSAALVAFTIVLGLGLDHIVAKPAPAAATVRP